jgi:hypothetical protein
MRRNATQRTSQQQRAPVWQSGEVEGVEDVAVVPLLGLHARAAEVQAQVLQACCRVDVRCWG